MTQSIPTQLISILGSTGSIGTSTLDVVARHPERYRVHALTGRTRLAELAAQCRQFKPARVVVGDGASAKALAVLLGAAAAGVQIDHGPDALCEVAVEADTVMAAIVGAAGLPSAMAAARAGRRVLLANKEALVMAGALFMDAVAVGGATLLPIDSEHNAIFQCLPIGPPHAPAVDRRVARVLLTASGGPFRTMPVHQMADVTPDQACAHPNWSMGRKISVDSATMMNKGLEVIEARWLFRVEADRIEVVIHPQSVIHSMVEYVDGSVLAQMGNPDMRTPIAHALAYPERIESGVRPLDLAAIGRLDFEKPDLARFPCLELAYHALHGAVGAPTVLNAANEVAVAAFLEGRLGFTAIADVVERVLDAVDGGAPGSLEDVLALDAVARARAGESLQRHGAAPARPVAASAAAA